jgi:YbbR domain-containing protein
MSWKTLFQENFWQKLFALGLAILIWLTVSSSEAVRFGAMDVEEVQEIAEIPIVVLTRAADVWRYEVRPDRVSVTLRGPAGLLSAVTAMRMEAYVNLVEQDQASGEVEIHVNAPVGTRVIEVDPPRVMVERIREQSQKP